MKFSGVILKSVFIEKGLERGFGRSVLRKIWSEGVKDEPDNFRHSNEARIILKSPSSENFWIKVETPIFSKVKSIADFKTLSIMVCAARPNVLDKSGDSGRVFSPHIRGRTLTTIGKQFGEIEKSAVSKRLKKAERTFGLKSVTRYAVVGGHLARLSNIYNAPVDFIRNPKKPIPSLNGGSDKRRHKALGFSRTENMKSARTVMFGVLRTTTDKRQTIPFLSRSDYENYSLWWSGSEISVTQHDEFKLSKKRHDILLAKS